MSSRLLTIEGVYDGKSIQPLETVKTDKKHRVLITFLDELSPRDEPHQEERVSDYIPEELFKQLQMLASATGVDDLKSFILDILQERVQAEKDKEFVFQVTDEVRAGLNRAGITEEEILEDFNQFRKTLAREQATLNH